MRVRYEMYKRGLGAGCIAECDLTQKKAHKRYEELKSNAKCGWVELVAEDDDEGGYMNIIESYEQIRLAKIVSTLVENKAHLVGYEGRRRKR